MQVPLTYINCEHSIEAGKEKRKVRMTESEAERIEKAVQRGPVEKYGTVGAGGLLSVLVYLVLSNQTKLEEKVDGRALRTDSAMEKLTESVNMLTLQITQIVSGVQPKDVKARVDSLAGEMLSRDDVRAIVETAAPWKEDKVEIERRLRELESSLMRIQFMLEQSGRSPPKAAALTKEPTE